MSKPWGQYVIAKVNLPDILRHELKKAKGNKVMLSTVTDCYQPIERELKLTRGCLEVLSGVPCSVLIVTKSPLVVRDIDILKRFEEKMVGVSISYHDDNLRKVFERASGSIPLRIKTLKTLKDSHVKSWAFISPIIPYVTNVTEIVKKLQGSVDSIGASTFNPYKNTLQSMRVSLMSMGVNFDRALEKVFDCAFWDKTEEMLETACRKTGITFEGLHRFACTPVVDINVKHIDVIG